MGIHDKHRERMRRRFLQNGQGFDEYQLLEMLLYHSIPRVDTNPAAHRLVDTFGSLKGVLDASPDELKSVEGIGERSAMLIKLVQAMSVAYVQPDRKETMVMDSSHAIGDYLWPKFLDKQGEVVFMICTDHKLRLLCCEEIGWGGLDASEVNVRKMVNRAINCNATGIILAHNHPSGVALPSEEDIEVTRKLKYLLGIMHFELLDHLIITYDDFVSMKDSNLI